MCEEYMQDSSGWNLKGQSGVKWVNEKDKIVFCNGKEIRRFYPWPFDLAQERRLANQAYMNMDEPYHSGWRKRRTLPPTNQDLT